jgi:hypothetical protein
MARVKAVGHKFKRLEIAVRQTLHDYLAAIKEIDKILQSPKRTHDEKKWLETIRNDIAESKKRTAMIAQKIIHYGE